MRCFLLPIVLGIGALGLLAAWANPSPFRRVDVVREVDGERETWTIWFGRWPVRRVERIPELHVTADFRSALRGARIRLPRGLEKKIGPAIRFRSFNRVEYRLSRSVLPTPGGVSFFESQLSHVRTLRDGSGALVEGVCPDERTELRYQAQDRPSPRYERLGLIVPGETHPAADP